MRQSEVGPATKSTSQSVHTHRLRCEACTWATEGFSASTCALETWMSATQRVPHNVCRPLADGGPTNNHVTCRCPEPTTEPTLKPTCEPTRGCAPTMLPTIEPMLTPTRTPKVRGARQRAATYLAASARPSHRTRGCPDAPCRTTLHSKLDLCSARRTLCYSQHWTSSGSMSHPLAAPKGAN